MPLRIAVAPDSFKGTLTSAEAASAIVAGMRRVMPPDTEYDCIPMADGGEGTVEAWIYATGAERIECDAEDPLGRRIRAYYGWSAQDKTAVVELASASGLTLLADGERDPAKTSTFGTGLVLRDALARGATRIVLGLGGSATNDAGAGLLEALGARIVDSKGASVGRGGLALAKTAVVDIKPALSLFRGVRLEAACDVTIPLCGSSGASAIFGPQKCSSRLASNPDALRKKIDALDASLRVFAGAVATAIGADLSSVPGTGAAGGTGFAVRAALGGALVPGAGLVASAVHLQERVGRCSLVISGEGRADSQTLFGKAPSAVADAARRASVPFALVCGQISSDAGDFGGALTEGSLPEGSPPPNSETAARLLRDAAERLGARFLAGQHAQVR